MNLTKTLVLHSVLLLAVFTNSKVLAQGACLNPDLSGISINDLSSEGTESQSFGIFVFPNTYSSVGGVPAGEDIRFLIADQEGYITVREGSYDGPVVAEGPSPVTVIGASGADLFAHWNEDSTCASLDNSFLATVQCISCGPLDCPGVGNFLDPCNNGDPLTFNDKISEDCQCLGITIPAGGRCEVPEVVEELPYHVEDYCSGWECEDSDYNYYDEYCLSQAYDFVFEYHSPIDQTVRVSYTVVGLWISSFHLFTGCPFEEEIFNNCDSEEQFGDVLTLELTANTTYYLMFSGSYTVGQDWFLSSMSVEKICPSLGAVGNLCDDEDPLTAITVVDENCECSLPYPGQGCFIANEIVPTAGLAVNPTTIDASEAYFSGKQGQCGLVAVPSLADTWFSYVNESSTMIIGVKGIDDYDPSLEAYKICAAGPNALLGCANATGTGGRERLILENQPIGETEFFRVMNQNPDGQSESYKVAVSYIPETTLDVTDCPNSAYTLSDTLWSIVPEFQYVIKGWLYEFEELEPPFGIDLVQSMNQAEPYITLQEIPELEVGRSYSVRVKTAYGNGEIVSDFGDPCIITIMDENGIVPNIDTNAPSAYSMPEMNLFPNPTNSDELTLAFANLPRSEKLITVRVYDLVGRQVLLERLTSSDNSILHTLNIEELSSGIYTVSAEIDGLMTSKKLVVE